MSRARKNEIANLYARNDVTKALDALSVAAVGYFDRQDQELEKLKKEEEKDKIIDMNYRKSQVNQLMDLEQSIDPNAYGDVVRNINDFNAYNADVRLAYNAKLKGKEFNPIQGGISPIAEETLFSYGGRTIDYDFAGISVDEMDQYEAYLLGSKSIGSSLKIAQDHNWNGLLSVDDDVNSAYYGKAVLDNEQYADLVDKGLVENIAIDSAGYYVLNQNDIDKVTKRWDYWKEGFYENNESLMTPGAAQQMVQGINTQVRTKNAELMKDESFKSKFDKLNKWDAIANAPFADGDMSGGILRAKNDFDDFKVRYKESPNAMDQIEEFSLEEFQEQFPEVYKLYYSGYIDFADVYYGFNNTQNVSEDGSITVGENQQLLAELRKLPDVEKNFFIHLQAFEDINKQRLNEGIDLSTTYYINDALANTTGKDYLMQEISLLDPNMMDASAIDSMPDNKIQDYANMLISLEQEIIDSQNDAAMLFLRNYGFNGVANGIAMEKFLADLRDNNQRRR